MTDGPTVMPISLASTPCCASVASSTRPPSSATRWSTFFMLPRLRMVPGGSFHGPWCGATSSPTAIASWPPSASMNAGGGRVGRSGSGSGSGSTYGSGSGSCSSATRSMAALGIESGASSSKTDGAACRRRSRRLRRSRRPPSPSPTAVRAFAAALPVARAVALDHHTDRQAQREEQPDDREPAEHDGRTRRRRPRRRAGHRPPPR